MGMRIQTNVSSLFAQRQLGISTASMNNHLSKLSSGYRINKAADDAAGLAISEKMKANIRSLGQAKRNASDGVSLVQTAEGGLNEITNIIVRLKELTVQAASDTIGNVERGYLQREFGSLKDEIDRIATASEFNGTKLLAGRTPLPPELSENSNPPPLEIQVGPNYFQPIDGLDVRNPVNIIRIDLQDLNATTDGPGSLDLGSGENADGTRIDSKEAAQMSMRRIEIALDQVNSYRATLGAIQNRLGSAISNLGTQTENIESAKSRIKDADFAEETAAVAQKSIMQQSGVSVLSQTNKMPELALKLLS